MLHDGFRASLTKSYLSRGLRLAVNAEQMEEEQNQSRFSGNFMTAELQDAEGAALRLYNGAITLAAYSSGTAQCLTVLRLETQRHQEAAGAVQAPLSIMYGTSAYLCVHAHTPAHSPHSNYSFSVARIPSMHAQHHAVLQVCEGVETGNGGATHKMQMSKKLEVIMVQGS